MRPGTARGPRSLALASAGPGEAGAPASGKGASERSAGEGPVVGSGAARSIYRTGAPSQADGWPPGSITVKRCAAPSSGA